jgi:hypothetical protein
MFFHTSKTFYMKVADFSAIILSQAKGESEDSGGGRHRFMKIEKYI